MKDDFYKKRCEENLDEFFKLFKLDKRASKKELELAYEVLTKNKNNLSNEEHKVYRKAFELLMTYHFKENVDYLKKENINVEKYMTPEEHYKNINENIVPKNVKENLDMLKDELNFSEKARAILATQKVNLALFYGAISRNSHSFFGIPFWTPKDIKNICKEILLSPLIFKTVMFDLSFTRYQLDEQIAELFDFAKNLKTFCLDNPKLCKKFTIKKSRLGVTGYCILEEGLCEHVCNMIESKSVCMECISTISEDAEGNEC